MNRPEAEGPVFHWIGKRLTGHELEEEGVLTLKVAVGVGFSRTLVVFAPTSEIHASALQRACEESGWKYGDFLLKAGGFVGFVVDEAPYFKEQISDTLDDAIPDDVRQEILQYLTRCLE